MNPYPFASLNHFTLPVAIHCLLRTTLIGTTSPTRTSEPCGSKVQRRVWVSSIKPQVGRDETVEKHSSDRGRIRGIHYGSNARHSRRTGARAVARVVDGDPAERQDRDRRAARARERVRPDRREPSSL